MADLSITVSNSLAVIGPSPSNKWGSFNWGENWGESGDMPFTVFKCFANTLSFSSQVYFTVNKLIGNSIAATDAIDLCCLKDSNGYFYVLEGGVTDPDDRVFPVYTEDSSSTDYTEDTPSTPTYIEG